MDFNKLIFTSSDYKMVVSVNGVTVPITILESFDYGAKKESEYIHRIGSDEPAGLKTNASTYPGKISMEAGELEIFLAKLGYVFVTQITGATISIVTPYGDLVKVFKGCVFESHDGTVKAKDKRSLITMDFKAVSVEGI
jgi:hypothetical protein